MQCFARWKEDKNSGASFRDQTIIQFGDSWDLLASFVLLNPGSALPKDREPQNAFLESLNLSFYVNREDRSYCRFSVDRLMNDLINLYSTKFSGGVLKLYNLFNFKNQDSANAIEWFKANRHHADMFTPSEDVRFSGGPVIIACGRNAFADEVLTKELKKYIALAEPGQLHSVSRVDSNLFSIVRALPDKNGIIESYHPSYTFKYGNSTILGVKT